MNQDDNSNVPAELIDKPFDYTNLELNSFSFSQPTYDVKDLLPKYQMTASTGQQFYVIEDDWVSSQVVLTHYSNQLKELTASITIEECWISDKISTLKDSSSQRIIYRACPVNEQKTLVYQSTVPFVSRFAWRSDIRTNSDPFYLHCEIRVCFEGETCPTMCTYGKPDEYWTHDLGYTPLSLHTRLGPFVKSGSTAVSGPVEMVGQDVSLLAEIKDIEGTKDDPLETSSSASVQGDFDNQAELPVWGMALIGTLTAGVVSVTIVVAIKVVQGQPLWRQTGLYRVSRAV